MHRGLAALDLEATCIRGPGCRVVSLALIPLSSGAVDISSILYSCEPPESVGGSALVHGVAGRRRRGPSLAEAIREAARYTLIVYGRHDIELLAAEAARRGLVLGRLCYKDLLGYLLSNPRRLEEARRRGRYTLEDALRELLGFEAPLDRFHDPISDALHTALLYLALKAKGDEPPTKCVERVTRGPLARLKRLILGR